MRDWGFWEWLAYGTMLPVPLKAPLALGDYFGGNPERLAQRAYGQPNKQRFRR